MKNNKFVDVFGDFIASYMKLSLFMFNFLFFGEKDVKLGSEFQRNHFPKMRIAAIVLLIFALFFSFKLTLFIVAVVLGFILFPWLLVLLFGLGFATYITIKEKYFEKLKTKNETDSLKL